MYFFYLAILILVYMCLWYVISLMLRRADVVDVAWGLGIILLSWVSFGMSSVDGSVQITLNILVTIWGLRLSLSILRKNIVKAEDRRYAKWRKEWKDSFYIRSFFQIFMLQAVIIYIVALPLLIVNYTNSGSVIILDIIGFFLWAIGFVLESFSDWQMQEFKKNPDNEGKILQRGIWQYSRHPNYFGEILIWWGIGLIVIGTGGYGWIGLLSPILITFLLIAVSGIPMAEAGYVNHQEYQAYRQRTSPLVPMPPSKSVLPPEEESPPEEGSPPKESPPSGEEESEK